MPDPESPTAEVPIMTLPPLLDEFHRNRMFRAIVPVAALLVSVGITVAIILLRNRLGNFAVYGYPGVFLVNLIGNATIILPAPAYAAVFAVGSVMDPVLVGIVGGLGAALGEMTGYLAGVGGRPVVKNRMLYERLEGWMHKRGMMVVIFLLALVPNPIFDVGGLLAGALRMPVFRFLLACWAGKTVRLIAIALIYLHLIASTDTRR
jgi:membrane protein YqaA with SNARE-associated domain